MAATALSSTQRDTLLLSHANPEDNEFTLVAWPCNWRTKATVYGAI